MFLFFVLLLCHVMLSGNFNGLEIQHGYLRVLNFGPGIFLGFVSRPKEFFTH